MTRAGTHWSLLLLLLLAAVASRSSTASAQETAPAGRTGELIERYDDRSITLPRLALRVEASFWIRHTRGNDDTFIGLDSGVAFGVTDSIEIGLARQRVGMEHTYQSFGLVPLLLTPRFQFGDIPLYARFRFLQKRWVEIGAEVLFEIPVRTFFGASLGMPVRFRFSSFAVDLQPSFRLVFLDDDGGPGRATRPEFRMPVSISFNLTDDFYLGVITGFGWVDFDDDGFQMPFGLRAGFTLLVGERAMIDLEPSFMLTRLIDSGRGDVLNGRSWAVTFNARLYFGFAR